MRRHLETWVSLPILVCALSTAWAGDVRADGDADASRISTYRGRYASPDAPALGILSLDASKLLRPGSQDELTGALASFGKGPEGAFRLPDAFAIEFAPWLLAAGAKLGVKDYNRHYIRDNVRLSFASSRADGSN